MTKKRFTYEYNEYSGTLFDNKMNTFYHIEDSDENIEVLCDRLNWLVEENEQLKKDCTALIYHNQGYRKENKQLQTKNNAYIQDIETYKEENTHLKLENEQLKDKYNEQSVEYEGLEEQVERLLDFKDKVFNLVNKKLKEADKGFEQTYDSWYQGQVDALKELKKKLQK